ncbi:hypothetical protein Syun_029858 [Stephania yunnanensis]|uniref:Uncharacterized protein n=1 Tax=Stephania yunnanensis TaxID=152371 RepID=A0AAP0HHN6_9MAGN
METSVEDRGATSSIGDKGILIVGAGSKEDTEISRTQSGDTATTKVNVTEFEGADDSSDTLTHAEHKTNTSFPDGLANLSLMLKQIGYIQCIPKEPYRPISADKSSLAHTANHPWQDALRYIEWFQSVSDPFAEIPQHVSEVNEEDESTLFRSMLRTNITVKNAIAIADAVMTFSSSVKVEEEMMVMTTTTHNDEATTSTIVVMPAQTNVSSEFREEL